VFHGFPDYTEFALKMDSLQTVADLCLTLVESVLHLVLIVVIELIFLHETVH
jgi:hypothetical protein